MKRMVGLMLLLSMGFSLLTGCGAGSVQQTASQTENPVETSIALPTEPTTEPETEPALNPDEILYHSLPEKIQNAIDLGIAELQRMENYDRICTGAEAATMLQAARVLKRGEESMVLAQVPDSAHKDIQVTRFWMAQMMLISEQEVFADPPYEDYLENVQYMSSDCAGTFSDETVAYFNHLMEWVVSENYGIKSHKNLNGKGKFDQWADQDAVISHAYATGAVDFFDSSWEVEKPDDWVKYVDYGSRDCMYWAMRACDKTTGEKLMGWDESMMLRPREKMTVEDAVEAAMRYYNYIPAEPVMLPYADVPGYDQTIITADLLEKETTLPEADCRNLPSQWKGVLMKDLLYLDAKEDADAKLDHRIYENEIQLIKDAGFNYVRILFDFEYLESERGYAYYICVDPPEEGFMNEVHLKELDQIIAWCMERDIHVNLSCIGAWGWTKSLNPAAPFASNKNAAPLAEQWAVLARRYAGIPSAYLSFTLFENPQISYEQYYEAFFTPVVEAIRAEDAHRCLIADISGKCTGESMAKLGVALSSRVDWPGDFSIHPSVSSGAAAQLMAGAAWPCEKNGQLCDAETAMQNRSDGWIAPDGAAAVAEQYGVGYMVSHWAFSFEEGNSVKRERFTDEMMQAYLADMSQTLAGRGYGWCYGNWFGFTGFGAAYPAIGSTTYTKVGNAPLYAADETFAWLQAINGAA